MNRKTANYGFTLIELLVVVSIIALLISILMPALNKAREQAKAVICKTNLERMHFGVFMYAADNNDRCFDYNFSRGLWLQRLVNYLDEIEEIRYCPSTIVELCEVGAYYVPGVTAFGTARMTWYENFLPNPNENGTVTQEYGSYAYNGWMYTELPSPIQASPTPEKLVFGKMNDRPGDNIPLIMDSTWLDNWPLATDMPSPELDLNVGQYPPSMGMLWTNRHNRRCNTVFLDGHVEGVNLEDLWSLKWHREFKYRSDIRF